MTARTRSSEADDRAVGAQWVVTFAGTIDAIQRGPIDNVLPAFAETAALQNVQRHVNYYNTAPWHLFKNTVRGAAMDGATENHPVPDKTHFSIDDSPAIRNDFWAEIRNAVWA